MTTDIETVEKPQPITTDECVMIAAGQVPARFHDPVFGFQTDLAFEAYSVALTERDRRIKELEAIFHTIHSDCGLFRMAIEMEDPKGELLERVKMIEEHIARAATIKE